MKKTKVLVVEDDLLSMELVTDLLEVAGYEVLPAETAEEGIEIAIAGTPALILMDIRLPGIDGLTATAILKDDPRTRAHPDSCFDRLHHEGRRAKVPGGRLHGVHRQAH